MIRRIAPRYCIASSGRRVRVAFDIDVDVDPGLAPEVAAALDAALRSLEAADTFAQAIAAAERAGSGKAAAQ